MFGSVDAVTQPYSNASIVRSLSLHGRCVIERITVFRPDSHHVHASEISTGLYVLETGKRWTQFLLTFSGNKNFPFSQVPIKRVHLFTLIQFACLVVLWLIKSFSQTSILFPLMLVVMIGIRKSLDFVFTRRELKILDDIMPEMTKRAAAEDLHHLDDVEVGILRRIVACCIGTNKRKEIPNIK